MKQQSLSIWFLIGLQLAIYGVLITGSGIYQYLYPPPHPLVLAEFHSAIWWGLFMGAGGIFYVLRFRPSGTTAFQEKNKRNVAAGYLIDE